MKITQGMPLYGSGSLTEAISKAGAAINGLQKKVAEVKGTGRMEIDIEDHLRGHDLFTDIAILSLIVLQSVERIEADLDVRNVIPGPDVL